LFACFVLLVVDDVLLRGDLELNGLFIVDSPTVGTRAFLVSVLETVEAELTYLISARTRLEVFVCEVKFFDAKRTAMGAWSAGHDRQGVRDCTYHDSSSSSIMLSCGRLMIGRKSPSLQLC
jgi:hypothetical protein